jgi:hypothetical protein
MAVVARDPNTTTKELMAFGGHSSVVAARRYRHATAERGKAIANYLDDVVKAPVSTQESTPVPLRS